jgi:hypothetical protein
LLNGWAFFNLSLVNADQGAVYRVGREVSYYAGSDWTEGSRSDEAVFVRVPAGRYYLSIETEVHPGRRKPLHSRLEVLRDVPRLSNLWILMGLLAVVPVIAFFRKSAFEVARWAESDHPLVTEGDSSDDC